MLEDVSESASIEEVLKKLKGDLDRVLKKSQVGIEKVLKKSQEREKELKKSQEQLNAMLTNLKDPVFVISEDNEIMFMNQHALEQFEEGYVGRKCYNALFGRNQPCEECPIESVIGAGMCQNRIEKTITLPSTNQMCHFDINVSLIENFKGKPAILELFRDVTKQREAEGELKKYRDHLDELVKERTHELKEAKDLSESIINSLPGVFYLFDDEGKFIRWNKNLIDLSEFSNEEISKMNLLDLFKGKNKNIIAKAIKDTLLKGENNVEAIFTSKSGKTAPYYFTGVRIMIDDKLHLIGMGIDITERRQAEENLEHTLIALKRSNKELSRFAYAASHDLQEPLRTIISYTQLFSKRFKDKIDDKADKYVDYILDGTMRMRNLITDLLVYSKIETHGIHFEPTNCKDLMENALSNLNALIKEKDAIITYDRLPTINGDPSHLTKLFQNLINNAIKFRGVKSPVIHISTKKVEHEWQFSVKDNGIGIDSKYFDKIFVIFERLHTRQEYPGTGIGLAICKKIVERHEGRIWVESEIGKGSTFYFTIPLIEYKNNQKI